MEDVERLRGLYSRAQAVRAVAESLQQRVRTFRLGVNVVPEAVAIHGAAQPALDPAADLHQAKFAAFRGQFVNNGVTNKLVLALPQDRSALAESRLAAGQTTVPPRARPGAFPAPQKGLKAARLGPPPLSERETLQGIGPCNGGRSGLSPFSPLMPSR